MLTFLKFFLALLSFLLLIFLVNISFFSVDKIENNKLSFLNEEEESEDTQEIVLGSWSKVVYNTKINFFDNIFHTKKDSFEIENDSDNLSIKLSPWVFILDLNDLSKKYRIISKETNFNIDLKSIWSLYIDNSTDKIIIFSIDSSFVLSFLNNNHEKINSYFIYPHEFIKFNYKLNFRYKNVDLYRIRTITKNGYFKYKILEDVENKSKISLLIWSENLDLFSYYTKNKLSKFNNNSILYKELNSLKNSFFPFSYYIDKYRYYFINNSKKIVYLQNIIYNKLIILFNSKKIDISLINDIKLELERLKALDEEKYEKVVHTIDNFYKVISLKNNIKDNIKFNNFLLLRTNNKNIKELENYINLKNIYFHSDFIDFEKSWEYFNLFLDSYLSRSWIKEQNENFTLNKEEKLSEIESFVFFLREYIYANLFSDYLEKLSSETQILSKYISLNKMIYFSGKKSETKIRTSLSQNLEILKNLEKFIRSNFFEEEKQINTDLLILKENKINFKDIREFELELDKIFEIFESNISFIEDEESINQYKKIKSLLKEELFAINDYQKYSFENNKKLKEIYNLATISDKNNKKYDINYIINYLSIFDWLTFNAKNITKEEDVFIIKDISILWKNYDMYLNPKLWNVVKIFNENTNVSYDLDNMEVLLEKKYNWSDQDDKYKYEFKNFFIQRFKDTKNIANNNESSEKCFFINKISDGKWWCKEIVNDDSAITVIKRDKLILWEFKIIKDFFVIKYDDLSVVINWPIVDIKILKSNIKSTIKVNWRDQIYNLEFSSKYDLEKHEFSDISIKFKDTKNNELYLYDEAEFEFKNNKVDIKLLKKFIDDFLINLNNIDSIYSILRWEIILSNLKISYIDKEIHLKFENNWKNINMVLEGDMIKSIIVDKKSILKEEINISNLSLILDKLK